MRVGKFREVGKGVRELWEVERNEMSVGFSLGNSFTIPTMKTAKHAAWGQMEAMHHKNKKIKLIGAIKGP